ncbi:MAG: LiaI-LiaF-like domain-containing protein [Candidatus Aminicenantia bacterium]
MTAKKKKETLIWGIVLIALGILFLLQNFDIGIWEALGNLWPLVLIGWGVWKLYLGIKERT